MFKPSNATQLIGLSAEFWHLAFEAQMVISMRLLGLGGFWHVAPSENSRMVQEKVQAFSESGLAMSVAAFRMAQPVTIMAAGLRPLRRRTRNNSRRLARRGPRGLR
ncbi:antifreeze protein [Actibacterium ureilyticum]|uniref:antifreeze protein n=1 Tax=Actibacterium ureilyticum TaxID=1590614 RepID=UPI000BAAB18A|nr:antifreeze protein [Actibacterium ureilyticum]